jgi:hypothetical protein
VSDAAPRQRSSRLLEIVAVVLLGVATVGSAWCGYEASRWNGEEAELGRESLDTRLEASRLFGLATQTITYDSSVILSYAEAVAGENDELAEFIRSSLMRPDFEPVLERWQADVDAGQTPESLLSDEAYIDDLSVEYLAAEEQANALALEGQQAGEQADEYVLTTLLFASALFFAGITSTFRYRVARATTVVLSALVLAYAASRLADLPVL